MAGFDQRLGKSEESNYGDRFERRQELGRKPRKKDHRGASEYERQQAQRHLARTEQANHRALDP